MENEIEQIEAMLVNASGDRRAAIEDILHILEDRIKTDKKNGQIAALRWVFGVTKCQVTQEIIQDRLRELGAADGLEDEDVDV